jgi:ABC-type enterobactin transport system permease subunit
VIFAGVPAAVVTAVLFVRVAHRDNRLEPNEIAVLGAGTGAFLLALAVDLVRSARRATSRG